MHLLTSGLLFICFTAMLPFADAKDPPKLQLSDDEKTILDLTNQARAKLKLPALKPDPLLFQAARAHSENMAKQRKMSHELDGKNPSDRVTATGFRFSALGENVASGTRLSPAGAIDLWMNSPPHKANMLSDKYSLIGIGGARDDKGELYYTQVFATELGGRREEAKKAAPESRTTTLARILELTNQARKKKNLPPFEVNEKLAQAAQAHADNMAKQKKLEHKLDGKTAADRVKTAGYSFTSTGENIAWSPELMVPEIFDGWMKSQGHRDNILNGKYRDIGLGVARNDQGEVYYVQVFGTTRND